MRGSTVILQCLRWRCQVSRSGTMADRAVLNVEDGLRCWMEGVLMDSM